MVSKGEHQSEAMGGGSSLIRILVTSSSPSVTSSPSFKLPLPPAGKPKRFATQHGLQLWNILKSAVSLSANFLSVFLVIGKRARKARLDKANSYTGSVAGGV